ncbi:MAG: ATP-binding protein [Nanoarchaeota archaeon]|nr:ATP-binding protein [Nanoarchaeota archaeon]
MTIQRPLTVEEICNNLRPILGDKVDKVYFQYSIAETREEREEIAHILNALYQKNLNMLLDKGVLLEPPMQNQVSGKYNLATVSYAKKNLYPFSLREQDFPRHICVTGMSGSGKTNFAFKILDALKANNKPYLVFDWKKSFRPLVAKDNTILSFTIGNEAVSNLFKTNINQPPIGISPKEWINVLCDFLVESFQASFGVHKVLLETLDEAFKEWGIYSGSENYPTWNHLKWKLEEKLGRTQGREAGWIESALRVATVLTFGEFGKTLNYKGDNSLSVKDLLDKRVIMELNSLGNIEKKVFCEFILIYIYKMKKAESSNFSGKFKHAIIVDEAHNIFLKKPTNFANESVTDMIYREMREYGTSLICLDQHISKISDTVKGNSACHIAFQAQLPQDIFDISELMQLRENKHYFSQLPVGSAIVKLSERYPKPFLIKVEKEDRSIIITDEDIKNRMKAITFSKEFEENPEDEFNKSIVYSEDKTKILEDPQGVSKENTPSEEDILVKRKDKINEFNEVQSMLYDYVNEYLNAGYGLDQIEETLEKSKLQGDYTSRDIILVINKIFENELTVTLKRGNNLGNTSLSKDEQVFMKFLQENPAHNMSTTEVYKAVNLSARKGTNIKTSLQEKGLVKIEEIKYEKGWKKLIRLA